MKTILFVHQSAELYGSDKMLQVLLSQLDRVLFTPVVILPGEGPLKQRLEQDNITVVIAPVLKVYRKMFTPANLMRFVSEIRQGIKILDKLNEQYNFDVVYSNTLAVLLGMIYARKRNLKHVWHVHEIIVHPRLIASAFPRLLKRFADVIICNSKATKNNLVSRIPALEQKCRVIYNGVEGKETGTAITKASGGYTENDVVVTLVGRISRLKGHKWLIEAFAGHLLATDIKLLFVGSPVPGQEFYEEEIKAIIAAGKLEDRIQIKPFTKDLQPVWAITDIAVMPSTEAESFGLVALEAMLAKKPVIGSDHGGLQEIIVNDVTGFLVEPSNAAKLADAIVKLASDSDLRQRMGAAGYNRARTEFSQDGYVEKISAILQNA